MPGTRGILGIALVLIVTVAAAATAWQMLVGWSSPGAVPPSLPGAGRGRTLANVPRPISPPPSQPRETTSAAWDRPSEPSTNTPLYTDGWLDDSGYTLVSQYTGRITDPESLDQVVASRRGRSERGIAELREVLSRQPAATTGSREAAELLLSIGAIRMYEGDFPGASAEFEAALRVCPRDQPSLRANLLAILGVAALRRGELENCIECRGDSSCILPLVPEAWHRKPSGSETAIRYFTAYLKERPEDLGIRWLLNLAAMTLGRYPDGVAREHVLPLDPHRQGHELGKFANVAFRVGLSSRGPNMSGGSLFDDFNNDGWIDVVTSTLDSEQSAAIYLNRGDGAFEDRTESSGLNGQFVAQNACHADFDNDGWIDVLLLRGGWENPLRPSLLRNHRDGTFEDVTLLSGLGEPIASQAGAWADYDNDGWLDLFLAGEFNEDRPDPRNRCRLYRNQGNGRFLEVAGTAGVQNDRFAKGAAWGDYDDDGYPDLYVSNMGQPNRLYHNDRDGTFTDVAPALGVVEPIRSFACWFWDFDNDGRLDIYVNAFGARLSEVVKSQLDQSTDPRDHPRLYRNLGPEGFRDVTAEVGLGRVFAPMGSNFGDVDNDGYLDVYLGTGKPPYSFLTPNVMLHNLGGKRFEDVTAATGTGHLQKGHGVSFADWDRDGDVDLFVEAGGATPGDKAFNLLFENPGHGHAWLTVKLQGTRTNRLAVGSRVTVETLDGAGRRRSFHRLVSTGSSFGGNSHVQTIGLGEASRVLSLEVRWAGGRRVSRFDSVPLNRAVEITEGRTDFRDLNWTPSLRREP